MVLQKEYKFYIVKAENGKYWCDDNIWSSEINRAKLFKTPAWATKIRLTKICRPKMKNEVIEVRLIEGETLLDE